MSRHQNRANAVCLMFEYGFGGNIDEIIQNAEEYREEAVSEDSRLLVKGAIEKLEEIDLIIGNAAKNWTINRIARLPFAVLRICVYELLNTQIPTEVCANEALELSREYGGEEYVSFINGVMGSIIEKYRA